MVAVRAVGLADEPGEEDQGGADEKIPHAHLQLAIRGVAVVEDKIEGLSAGEEGRGLVWNSVCGGVSQYGVIKRVEVSVFSAPI